MGSVDIINLVSSIASLALSIIAIWLSLDFYNRGKDSERNTTALLTEIKSQTTLLERITSRQLDRFTKYAVSAKPADETVTMLLELVKTNISISSNLKEPNYGTLPPETLKELVSCYIAIYRYTALTNISFQGHLPQQLVEVGEIDYIRSTVDTSYADFCWLEDIIMRVKTELVTNNPLYGLYQDTMTNLKPYVKDSLSVYRERELSFSQTA